MAMILVARRAGPEAFGEFSNGLAIGAIGGGFLGLGLSSRALLLAGPDRVKRANTLLTIGFLSSILLGCSVALILAFSFNAHYGATLAAAVYTGSELLILLYQNLLYGEGRPARAGTVIVTRRAVLASCAAASMAVPAAFVMSALTIAAVVSLLVVIGIYGAFTPSLRRAPLEIRESVAFWHANVWSMAQQLDVPLMTHFLGPTVTASYAAAFRLASPVHLITSSLTSLYVPQLRAESEPARRLWRGQRLSRIATIGTGSLILASPIFSWIGPVLYGPEYASTAALFALLFVNSALSLSNQIDAGRLLVEGKASTVSRATAVSTLLGLVGVLVGCLLGSPYWAAGGTVLNQVLLGVFLKTAIRSVRVGVEEGSVV